MTKTRRLLVFIFLVFAASVHSAPAGSLSYDPESCAVDAEGKLHVRMPGGYEFAFPVDAPIQLGSPVEALQDLPRDASEPEGCPTNPATMTGINLSWSASRYGDESIGALKPTWAVGKLSLKAAARRYVRRPEIDLQLADLEGFERLMQDIERINGFHEVLFPGFEVAYGRPPSYSEVPTDGAAMFRASPGFYDEFDGRAFVGTCSVTVMRGRPKRCSLSYHLACGLHVYYTFWTNRIRLDDLLDADQQIRHFIRVHALVEFPTESSTICGALVE